MRQWEEEGRMASSNAALREEDEFGVAGVSHNLFEKVTKYHAQIGANVNREVLQHLEWNLLGEAKALFHQRKFEEALNTFTHCLAVTEKTRSSRDHAVRGAVIHNIASCLHNLGEMEAAQAYYEQAIDAFKKASTPMIERMFYGDANKRRIDFVKERLVDINWGRKPDGDKYLDENGQKRPVPEALSAAADANNGDQILTERWRENGPEPPPLPGWMGEQGGAGGYDVVPSANDYMPGFNEGGYGPPRGAYGGGGRPAQEQSPPPHVSSNQYLAPSATSADGGGAAGGGAGGGVAAGGAEGGAEAPPDSEQEAARKEWLQYHLQVGEWDEARELIVTQQEQEDLEYLMSRQKRLEREERQRGGGRGGRAPQQAEDF